jgi:CHAT domain-containing protein/Tfp pilus assembly protein PilF
LERLSVPRVLIRVAAIVVAGFLAAPGGPAATPLAGSTAGAGTSPAAGEGALPTPDDVRALLKKGAYGEAEALARRLLVHAEADPVPVLVETAGAIDLLVEALLRGGKAGEVETESLARRALALRESLSAPDDPEIARSLNGLARVHGERGEYREARPLYERALAVRERALGPDSLEVSASLNNLGILMKNLGEYDASRHLQERALAIRRARLGPDHPDVAVCLHNLAGLLWSLGDYPRARVLAEQAIVIWEKSQGADHPHVAQSLVGLGILAVEEGDPAGARPLLERAVAINEQRLGPRHPDVANALSSLSSAQHDLGDSDAAARSAGRALEIFEKALGPDHPDVAGSAASLAEIRLDTGDAGAARPLLERSLRIREHAFGPDHPLVAQTCRDLARARMMSGESGPALEDALRAEVITARQFRQIARSLSEREAMRFADARVSGKDVALSVLAGTPAGKRPAGIAGRVLDAVIRARALILDEMAARHRTVAAADESLTAPSRVLEAARHRLARLVTGGAGDDNGTYLERLRHAQEDKDVAERVLAERSASFRSDLRRERVGLEDVAGALPPDSALVSFVRYRRLGRRPAASGGGTPKEGVGSYLAFVLRAGEREPDAFALGEAATIDERIRAWRRQVEEAPKGPGAIGRAAEERYRPVALDLRRAIWDPLTASIGAARLVFVVLDGDLHVVSLSTLPAGRESYLVETGPLIHYLTTERDLLSSSKERARGSGLLALGGADYQNAGNADVLRVAGASPVTGADPDPARTAGRRAVYRGPQSACGDFRTLRFEPLPGSLLEAEDVGDIWSRTATQRDEGPARVFTGPLAAEAIFKELAPSSRFVHLATHGFFLGGRCGSPAVAGSRGVGGPITALQGTLAESPLLLSGLALAGANRRDVRGAAEDGEDGILTAEEVAALDLSGVEWAVLSACDTGIGTVHQGEGVLGLRRAFEIAGAGSLIMSLWSVQDAVTREWMETLYEARLGGHSTAESVRRAAVSVIENRRRAGWSTHPFYWGAFVAAGDWR